MNSKKGPEHKTYSHIFIKKKKNYENTLSSEATVARNHKILPFEFLRFKEKKVCKKSSITLFKLL